jgi:hypothetical protein
MATHGSAAPGLKRTKAMTTKRKPTLKQLFKAWLKHREKNNEVLRLKWNLDNLANKTEPGTELIVHDGTVYRITTRNTFAGRINYEVEHVAKTEEIETIK